MPLDKLDMYEFAEVEEALIDNVEEILSRLNSNGKIGEFLKLTGLDSLFDTGEKELVDFGNQDPKGKIVVIGGSTISSNVILGIGKKFGISKGRFELYLDYRKAQKLNYNHMRYNPNYALILFGPVGHSAKDKGGYSSIITAIEQKDGYPPVMRLGTTALKISKTTVNTALEEALTRGILEKDVY